MSTKSIGRPLMVFRLILIINIVLSLLYFQHMPEFYLFSFRACLKNHFRILCVPFCGMFHSFAGMMAAKR